MTNILVIGGAGYIGSHTVRELEKNNFYPVIYDNLSTGFKELVPNRELVIGDIKDQEKLSFVINKYKIEAVIHFAAYICAGESVTNPAKYYDNNIIGTISLLDVLLKSNVNKFILSSTAGVYGEPKYIPIDEEHPKVPINPYGKTKFFIEEILSDYDKAYKLKSIKLRYFNAAGADIYDNIGEAHFPETHLIPLVIEAALGNRDCIEIYGTDYNTPDGTCIRDYIHVSDLANAHVLALKYLFEVNQSNHYNVGTGKGYSVKEVINKVKEVTSREIKVIEQVRREGDPASLVAKADKIREEFRWKPKFSDLDTIIKTAFKWHSSELKKELDIVGNSRR